MINETAKLPRITAAEIRAAFETSEDVLGLLRELSNTRFSTAHADNDPLPTLAYNAMNKLLELYREAKNVEEIAQRVRARIMESFKNTPPKERHHMLSYASVNSLGELQGLASSFDVACARYYDVVTQLTAAIGDVLHADDETQRVAAEQATLAALTDNHRQIIAAMREHGDMTKQRLTKQLGIFPAMLDVLLPQLVGAGIVTVVGREGRHYRFVTLTPIELRDDIPASNRVDETKLSDAEVREAIMNNGRQLGSSFDYSMGEADRAVNNRTGLIVYRRNNMLFAYFETK